MSKLTIYDYFHESGYGGRDEKSEDHVLETKGSGTDITVVLTSSTSTKFPPQHSSSSESQWEIDGQALARLIQKHGKKIA